MKIKSKLRGGPRGGCTPVGPVLPGPPRPQPMPMPVESI